MPRDYELDRLKSAEEEAFAKKQEAYQAYDALRKETDAAYAVMVSARDILDRARSEMNDAYEALQRENAAHDEVWDEYGRLRDTNNSEIESLKYEADLEAQMMHDCFENASSSYEYGDKAMASEYSQQGHAHKDRLAELNARIRELGQEVKQAREDAQWRAPKVGSSAFVAAKRAFQDAKARYESLRSEFDRLKEQRDAAKERFHAAKEAHATAKERFQARLAEVKERRAREREHILDQAGVRGFERDDAKIVKKADGTTQVYHGGLGSGDGIGHGHTALDSSGQRTYDRGAFEEHGSQNYTDDGKGVTIYDRRARPGKPPMGISGGVKLRPNSGFRGSGQNWDDRKPGVIGHSTMYWEDGVRLSSDTRDGVHEENVHWTDERLPEGPDKHKKPKD